MTVTGLSGTRPGVGGSPRSARSKVLLTALITLAVVACVGVWKLWTSPDAFREPGDEVDIYARVGTTAFIGVATPRQQMDPASLTLHSVEPRLTVGRATIDVLVCHTGPGKTGIVTARGHIDPYCESQEGPAGAQLRPGDQLVLRVRSDDPGRVVVEGVNVSYSHGWRRGSQATGATARVDFGTATVREHFDGG